MSKAVKSYREETLEELRRATREFDAEDVNPKAAVISREEKAHHDAILRELKTARTTRRGKKAKRVQILLDESLLEKVDEYARQKRITRSQLFAAGLRLAMSA